jgi:hypothetical protein
VTVGHVQAFTIVRPLSDRLFPIICRCNAGSEVDSVPTHPIKTSVHPPSPSSLHPLPPSSSLIIFLLIHLLQHRSGYPHLSNYRNILARVSIPNPFSRSTTFPHSLFQGPTHYVPATVSRRGPLVWWALSIWARPSRPRLWPLVLWPL